MKGKRHGVKIRHAAYAYMLVVDGWIMIHQLVKVRKARAVPVHSMEALGNLTSALDGVNGQCHATAVL
jgi:hypothetical protein